MMFRIRFGFKDGHWHVASCKASNEFASRAIQPIEEKRIGQKRLPVLSELEPHEFLIEATPYRCVCSYLGALPDDVKRARANG